MAVFSSVKKEGKEGCLKGANDACRSASDKPIYINDWTEKKILDIPKPANDNDKKRPQPEDCYEPSHIKSTLDKFDEGGSYIILEKHLKERSEGGFGRDPVGAPDGLFMMPKAEMDELLKLAKDSDDPMGVIETALGFDKGTLKDQKILRIDVPNPKIHGLRMASGNESCADPELWRPGGKTLGGRTEAITNPIPKGSYIERDPFE